MAKLRILDNEEMLKAKDAVRLLYRLGIIDMTEYEFLLVKIDRNTGA